MMSQMMKIITIYMIGLAVIGVTGRPHCEISDASADECGKRLMFIGEQEATLPKTDDDMKARCKHIEEGMDCLKKYSKTCLDPFATQIMNIVVKNGDKMEGKYCKNDGERKKLLEAFKCAGSANLAPLHMCMDKFIVQMEHLAEVNGDHRIAATCCSFQMLHQCVHDEGTKLCTQPDKIEYITKFLTEMTSEIIESGCGNFDSLAHCDKSMDKTEWDKLKALVASNDPKEIASKKINSSPFMALKGVMHKLMDE